MRTPEEFGAIGDGVADDTIAIQSAINVAIAARASVKLGEKTYRITAPLIITGSLTFEGVGVNVLTGPLSAPKSVYVPQVAPYLTGSVLLQSTADADVIQITTGGITVNMRNFGIRFADSIRWSDTGHGINQLPPPITVPGTAGSYRDNGIQYSEWANIMVYGHDGDHYAFRMCNSFYNQLSNLGAIGGGALCFENDSPNDPGCTLPAPYTCVTGYTGNMTVRGLWGQIVAGGSAHGIHLKNTSLGNGGGPAHISFWGCQTSPLPGFGAPTNPTAAQHLVLADPQCAFLSFIHCPFEGLWLGSKVVISTPSPGLFMSPQSSTTDTSFATRDFKAGFGQMPMILNSPISWGDYGSSIRLLRFLDAPDGSGGAYNAGIGFDQTEGSTLFYLQAGFPPIKWRWGTLANDGTTFTSIMELDSDARLSLKSLRLTNLHTSDVGLPSGSLWNDGGTLKIA